MDVEQLPRSLRTPHPVPPLVARGMRIANSYSEDILHTLRYGLVVSQVLGTVYVTDNKAEADLLSVVSGRRDIAKRNQIAAEHLSTIIPFLPEIPIRAPLRLRATETFLRYRAALGKCLSTLENSRPTGLTENDARSLYGDVIAPELARIQILVRDARRRTISGAGRALLG